MNETLFVALVIAAVSSITYVAYRHSDGYLRIYRIVMPVAIVAGTFILSYNSGGLYVLVGMAYDNLQNSPNDSLKDHSRLLNGMFSICTFVKQFLVYYVPAMAYLVFLKFLPSILGLDSK